MNLGKVTAFIVGFPLGTALASQAPFGSPVNFIFSSSVKNVSGPVTGLALSLLIASVGWPFSQH